VQAGRFSSHFILLCLQLEQPVFTLGLLRRPRFTFWPASDPEAGVSDCTAAEAALEVKAGGLDEPLLSVMSLLVLMFAVVVAVAAVAEDEPCSKSGWLIGRTLRFPCKAVAGGCKPHFRVTSTSINRCESRSYKSRRRASRLECPVSDGRRTVMNGDSDREVGSKVRGRGHRATASRVASADGASL
jgi:hypothetical protein